MPEKEMKIKRRTSDILYSQYLRKLRNYTCERCGRKFKEGDGLYGLHVSHFYGRAKESVRFEPNNTDLLCYGCHSYFSQNPQTYRDWKEKKMGEKAFKALTVQAHTLGKRDDKLVIIALRSLIKNL